jgi:hypothetical protein
MDGHATTSLRSALRRFHALAHAAVCDPLGFDAGAGRPNLGSQAA